MGIFDGILICTDLDGTLLTNDKTISVQNIEAIEYFKSNGGIFTFITGRMPFFAAEMYNTIKPNAPFGCINGGALYDYSEQRYIQKTPMSTDVIELVEYVDVNLPSIGIQPNTYQKVYFSKDNSVMEEFRRLTGAEKYVCDYHNLDETLVKIVFGAETDDEMTKLKQLLQSHPLAHNFDFIQSETTLYEILPKGINKGVSISALASYLGIDAKKTIAIGDFYNDIPMFEAAGVGVAVANACPQALEAADLVTVSNEEHAIAQIISDVKSKKIEL